MELFETGEMNNVSAPIDVAEKAVDGSCAGREAGECRNKVLDERRFVLSGAQKNFASYFCKIIVELGVEPLANDIVKLVTVTAVESKFGERRERRGGLVGVWSGEVVVDGGVDADVVCDVEDGWF